MELNEGIRLLSGKPRIDIPLKKKEEAKPAETQVPAAVAGAPSITSPVTTQCTVTEKDVSRVFTVTIEPIDAAAPTVAPSPTPAESAKTETAPGTNIYSTFAGSVEVTDIKVKVGDSVKKGQAVAEVEAMKAQHDIKCPCDGKVSAIHVSIGDEVDSTKPILTVTE